MAAADAKAIAGREPRPASDLKSVRNGIEPAGGQHPAQARTKEIHLVRWEVQDETVLNIQAERGSRVLSEHES